MAGRKRKPIKYIIFTCACNCGKTRTLPESQYKQRKATNHGGGLFYNHQHYLKSRVWEKGKETFSRVIGIKDD